MRILKILTLVMLISLAGLTSVLAKMPTAVIGKSEPINLEVASTPIAIEHGLMDRTSLNTDSGMVFLFGKGMQVNFWMYHTLIPLDMIFINNGKVIKIFENVPPCKSENKQDCTLYPGGQGLNVTEVIEVNAGYAKSHNLKVGDTVTFKSP